MITSGDKAMKYLTKEELARFKRAVDAGGQRVHQLAFRLILYFGLRVQECVNIRLREIEEGESITIRGLKHGRQRTYVGGEVPGKIWKHYRAWMKKRGQNDNPCLFPSRLHEKRPLTAEALKAAFRGYVEQAGLGSRYSVHALRHTCAVLMVEDEEQPTTIMNWLRHRAISSTQVYIEAHEARGAGERQAKRSEAFL